MSLEVDYVHATEQIFQLTETSMITTDLKGLGSIEMQAASAVLAFIGLLTKLARIPVIKKRARACQIKSDRGN